MPVVSVYGKEIDFGDLQGEELQAAVSAAARQLAQKPAKRQDSPSKPLPTPMEAAGQGAKRGLFDLIGGAVRGAGSIGATIVAPGDMLVDAIKGDRDRNLSSLVTGEKPMTRNQQRRAAIDRGLTSLLGSDPESFGYQFGKVVGEVAGTAGMGPLLGSALLKVAPRAAPLADAVSTGGMGSAPITARMLGGAITGGASAGAVDPEQAKLGAAIGGGLPAAIPLAGAVSRKVGGLASEVLGLGTGAGSEAVRQAAKAGMEGGKRAESFTANMRGQAPMTDALDIAKSNLEAMRRAKNAEYRSGMVDISNDKAVIDFADIDNALTHAADVTRFKGQVKNARAESVRAEIAQAVEEWKQLDPAEYHTPEGFDALKQRIGAIVESVPMEERTAAKVGKDIYHAIKQSITKQAPAYAKVMRDYSQAADDIAEAEKALSLGGKASVDTAMRKLQSLTRNNANTNYGNRLAIAEQLQQQGGQEFLPALSGQALSSWMPRGLSGLVASGAGAAGYLSGGMSGAASALPVLASQSPRVVGEAAYGVGQLARLNRELAKKLLESRAAPVIYTSGGQ